VQYRVLAVLAGERNRTTYLAERQSPARRFVTLEVVGADDETLTPDAFLRRLPAVVDVVHPSVARTFDGGISAAGDYFAIGAYTPGPRIDRYCQIKELAPAERLRLFLDVCQATGYVHAQGLVHGGLAAGVVVVVGAGEFARAVVTGLGIRGGRTTVADDVRALIGLLGEMGTPHMRSVLRPDDSARFPTVNSLCQAIESRLAAS
jgi:hypothetical protein